jgi:hypothetical protein
MDISKPNMHGVLPEGLHDVVTRRNRAYAAVNIALCEDGLYRMSVEMRYSHGGFSGPITIDGPGYPTIDAARTAGLEELLRRWHAPFPSDPQSVRDELADLRRQVEAHLQQPSLF